MYIKTKIKQLIQIITLAAAATLSSCSVAYAGDKDTIKLYCHGESLVAEATMKARQAGVPLHNMMELADGNVLWETYVEVAYSQPQFNTQEHQEKITKEFGNQVYLSCYKQLRQSGQNKRSKNNT